MKILITGATGLIGTNICRELSEQGHHITIFSRNASKAESSFPYANEYVGWDYRKPDEWKDHLNFKDAVIHLAGANLFSGRWTEEYKQKILESRELSTQNIVKAIGQVDVRPGVFICASGAGYYGDQGEKILTEISPPGNGFTSEVCRRWEEASLRVEDYNVRRVCIRTGVVLNKGDGALKKLATPFRFFVGGTLGSGLQWFPWIHIRDLVNIYLFVMMNNIRGSVNAVSPYPIRLMELTDEIGKILGRPSLFKVPAFALRAVLGEFADELLASSRVIPKKLNQNNFNFRFGKIEDALRDLLENKSE